MAIIKYLEDLWFPYNSRYGNTFDTSQAGPIVKRRPCPTNPSTPARNKYRTILADVNKNFWGLTWDQKLWWRVQGSFLDITGPFGRQSDQKGNAAYVMLMVNVVAAGDDMYDDAPGDLTITGPTWGTLSRIDDNTVRITFTAGTDWSDKRIYLRQALPGPGYRRWAKIDSFMCEYSERSPTSPHDFTIHFPHIAGWNCRYWLGCQHYTGYRIDETIVDLSA